MIQNLNSFLSRHTGKGKEGKMEKRIWNSWGGRRGISGKLRLKRNITWYKTTDLVAGVKTLVSTNLGSARSTGLNITSACPHLLYICNLLRLTHEKVSKADGISTSSSKMCSLAYCCRSICSRMLNCELEWQWQGNSASGSLGSGKGS